MTDAIAFGIDYAWAQIPSPAIKAAGCSFVMRYLGGSARLTDAERRNHQANDLSIMLFVEQEPDEAEKGFGRGVQLAQVGNSEADSLGYPADALLVYADDHNDPDVAQEIDFMRGVKSVGGRPSDMYSGGNVLAALSALGLSPYGGVCVETWYRGFGEDPFAVQLANTRDPIHIPGISDDQFDTDLLYRLIPMWAPDGSTTPTKPTPAPQQGDDDMPHFAYLKRLDGSTGQMLVDGGFMTRDFGVAPPGAPFGLTKEYLDWRAGDPARADLKSLRYDLPEWAAVRKHSGQPD